MERNIKVEKLNEEGKMVDMTIPKNLLSMYENIGWKKQEKKKEVIRPNKEYRFEKKEEEK